MPASQDTLVTYMAYLARRLSSNSIPNYMNVIRIIHLQAGLPNPLEHNFELGLLKKGISREKGVPPKQKLPIGTSMLRNIHATLNFGKPSDLAFWCACVLGFLGLLRKSTLLPKNHQSSITILRSDITKLDLSSFTVLIRHSKVIQFGERIHAIPYALSSDSTLCPVRALLAHLGASPLDPSRPLFNYKYHGHEVFMTQSSFATRLKSVIAQSGTDSSAYSAHSLRRGGASYAFQIGVSPLQIKLRGDWASNAFERYVFISSQATGQVATMLSEGLLAAV